MNLYFFIGVLMAFAADFGDPCSGPLTWMGRLLRAILIACSWAATLG